MKCGFGKVFEQLGKYRKLNEAIETSVIFIYLFSAAACKNPSKAEDEIGFPVISVFTLDSSVEFFVSTQSSLVTPEGKKYYDFISLLVY